MSLNEKIFSDLDTVYLNSDHFAEYHTWNGMRFKCVADTESSQKARYNLLSDISWENNLAEITLFIKKCDCPFRITANEHIYLDKRPYKVLAVHEDMGMYKVELRNHDPKAVLDG